MIYALYDYITLTCNKEVNMFKLLDRLLVSASISLKIDYGNLNLIPRYITSKFQYLSILAVCNHWTGLLDNFFQFYTFKQIFSSCY